MYLQASELDHDTAEESLAKRYKDGWTHLKWWATELKRQTEELDTARQAVSAGDEAATDGEAAAKGEASRSEGDVQSEEVGAAQRCMVAHARLTTD